MEATVFERLKAGNEVLNELNKLMDVDKVEQLMQETADAIAYQNVGLLFLSSH
jgi:charged multivesicular body protein 6